MSGEQSLSFIPNSVLETKAQETANLSKENSKCKNPGCSNVLSSLRKVHCSKECEDTYFKTFAADIMKETNNLVLGTMNNEEETSLGDKLKNFGFERLKIVRTTIKPEDRAIKAYFYDKENNETKIIDKYDDFGLWSQFCLDDFVKDVEPNDRVHWRIIMFRDVGQEDVSRTSIDTMLKTSFKPVPKAKSATKQESNSSNLETNSANIAEWCFNPRCKEIGKSFCSRCHSVKYCSQKCQKEHWRHHKAVCFDRSKWAAECNASNEEKKATQDKFNDIPMEILILSGMKIMAKERFDVAFYFNSKTRDIKTFRKESNILMWEKLCLNSCIAAMRKRGQHDDRLILYDNGNSNSIIYSYVASTNIIQTKCRRLGCTKDSNFCCLDCKITKYCDSRCAGLDYEVHNKVCFVDKLNKVRS